MIGLIGDARLVMEKYKVQKRAAELHRLVATVRSNRAGSSNSKSISSKKKKSSVLVMSVRDITKLSGYPRSNVKTRLEQSNLFLASGRFPLQNAIYDNKLPFSRM